jgi:hypothetical protein
MKLIITIDEFIKQLNYKPKWITNDLAGMQIIQFRDYLGFSASVEFSTELNSNGTQSIYFDILDLRNYNDGDFIPIDSDMRKCILKAGMSLDKNVFEYAKTLGKEYDNVWRTPEDCAKFINDSLKLLYSKKLLNGEQK